MASFMTHVHVQLDYSNSSRQFTFKFTIICQYSDTERFMRITRFMMINPYSKNEKLYEANKIYVRSLYCRH